MATIPLSMNAGAYVQTTVVTSSTNANLGVAVGTATEIVKVKNLNLNLSSDKADVTTRDNSGWKQSIPTLRDGTVTFDLIAKAGSTVQSLLRDAWLNQTEIFFAALDQKRTTAWAEGIAGNFTVTNFSRSEQIADAVVYSVEMSTSSYTGWYQYNPGGSSTS